MKESIIYDICLYVSYLLCFFFFFLSDEFCDGYPHNFTPTPGYWIECSRQSGRADRRRNHGIQEEGSQEDSNSPSDEEDDDDDDDDDEEEGEKEREENDNGTGIQTDSFDGGASSGQLNQRHANGGINSVFTSTDSVGAGTSDRSGRKVQLVHQHIQVPVDDKQTLPRNLIFKHRHAEIIQQTNRFRYHFVTPLLSNLLNMIGLDFYL
jgi:hypothetical protein